VANWEIFGEQLAELEEIGFADVWLIHERVTNNMFKWFKPQCPVDPEAKRWIEKRLHWLSEQFGQETFTRRAIILPTRD